MKQQEELFYKMSSKVEEKDEPDDLTVMAEVPEDNDVITEETNPKIQPIDTKPWKSISLKNRVGQFGRDSCEKVEKVYFLKTSKTGSTTMANILMRFGFRREGTNFLLGETPNGA